MRDIQRVIEAIMASGKIDHEITAAEFGGPNCGMDEFRTALEAEGLELYSDLSGDWYIYARNAGAAFKHGLAYRPRTWGVGVHACDPRERGVDVFRPNRVVMDGVEISAGEGAQLVLFEYLMSSGTTRVRKRAIARRQMPSYPMADEFSTAYRWVENPNVVVEEAP